jgi:hypothetical protein
MMESLLDLLGLGGAGTVGGVGGFALWKLSAKVDALTDSLSAYKVHVAETYATNNDVRDVGDRIEKHLQRIEDKLDKKVDK